MAPTMKLAAPETEFVPFAVIVIDRVAEVQLAPSTDSSNLSTTAEVPEPARTKEAWIAMFRSRTAGMLARTVVLVAVAAIAVMVTLFEEMVALTGPT